MTILIVGGGKMGLSHLAIASRIAGPANVAVCESNRLIRLLYNRLKIRSHSSIEGALASDHEIKGAIIATPTPSHYAISKMLLEHSIPCFIEKPLTLKVTKSTELMDLASSGKVYTQMGFVLRYVSTFSRLRDLVRTGALGTVRSYRARMNGNVITKPDTKSWRTDFSAGGGCLNEYGPHLIDLCRFIFGDVMTLESAEKGHVHSTRADDQMAFNWIHASGAVGEVKLDWCDTSKRKSVIQFEVDFEHARVSGDNSALHFDFHADNSLSPVQRSQISGPLTPPKVSFYLRGEEYTLQLEDFIGRCMGHNYRVDHEFGLENGAQLQDGLAVDLLIESISKKAGLQ